MDKNRKGILLTSDFELAIHPVRDVNGLIISGLVVGNSIDQEAMIVLQLRPGELKEDPLLGPGLTQFIRGKYNKSVIENTIKQHFTRAGIDYEDYKERIQLSVNK
ncbi:MAG TPA: hypothetical protein VIK29_07045 [Paludibacter sp.]